MKNKFYYNILIMIIFFNCRNSTPAYIDLSGTVEVVEVNVSSEIPGRIKKINVNEGARVKRGEVVIIFDKEKYQLQYEQADGQYKALEKNLEALQLNYSNAEKNFERIKKLREENAIDEAQFDLLRTQRDYLLKQIDATRSQLSSAGATRALAEKQLDDAEVKSPIDGVVLHKLAEEGEVVAQGMPLLIIGDLDHPWVRTYVPQRFLGKIKLGQEVMVISDSFPEKEFKGKIIYISSKEEFTPKNLVTEEERTKMVYAIKVAIDNSNQEFKPGQYVNVRIPLHE